MNAIWRFILGLLLTHVVIVACIAVILLEFGHYVIIAIGICAVPMLLYAIHFSRRLDPKNPWYKTGTLTWDEAQRRRRYIENGLPPYWGTPKKRRRSNGRTYWYPGRDN
jgi:hypothetical protein